MRSYDAASGVHRAYTLCQNEPDKLFGRTVGRSLIGSAGVLVLVTLVSLPLLARTERRRPSPA